MLNNREKWTVALLLVLANHPRDKPASKKVLIGNLNIGIDYAEQLLAPLSKAGIVKATRGRSGGFYLVDRDITLWDVLEVIRMKKEPEESSIPWRVEEVVCRMQTACEDILKKEKIVSLSLLR